MKKLPLVLALICTGFTCLPVLSQPIQEDNTNYGRTTTLQKSNLGHAQNLARQAAEKANGGLSNYRAEPAMYGNPQNSPYVENNNGSWTFSFKGRRPNDLNYTIETIVTVNRDFSKISVDYNGPIR